MLDFAGEDHDEMRDREAADLEAERARALWHASAIRFCPQCAVEVLTRRDSTCVWCDGPTIFSEGAGGDGVVPVTPSRASTTQLPVVGKQGASLNPSPAPAGDTGLLPVACTAPTPRSAGRATRSGAQGNHIEEERAA